MTAVAFGAQMVWEHGCTVIVMLSPLAEDSVKQCDRYWPDEGSSLYHIYEASAGRQRGAPRSPRAGGGDGEHRPAPALGARLRRVLRSVLTPAGPPLLRAGEPGVGAHLVRGLPGAQLLPEERAVAGDPHPDAVPLPQLAGRGHPRHHPAPPRLPQVGAGPGRGHGGV